MLHCLYSQYTELPKLQRIDTYNNKHEQQQKNRLGRTNS